MTAEILIAIFAICHADKACMTSVADLYPQTPSEVILAYESLGLGGVCHLNGK